MVLALAACQRASEPARAPVAPPADLLFEASLPDLEGGLAGINAYAERVEWDGARDLSTPLNELANVAGVRDLGGARRDRPVRLLSLSSGPHGIVHAILVGVGDEQKLRAAANDAAIRVQGGYALAGEPSAVERLAPYALGTLARQPAAPAPRLLVYAPVALAAFGAQIEAQREQWRAMALVPGQFGSLEGLLDAQIAAIFGLLRQSTTIELRLDASAEAMGVDIAFSPRSGSNLAELVAAQKPSAYPLLERLPARSAASPFIVAGHVELGCFRAEVRSRTETAVAGLLGVALDDELRASLSAWFDQLTGEVALAIQVGPLGPRLDMLAGTLAGKRASEQLRVLFERLVAGGTRPFDFGPAKMLASARLDAGHHDGVALMSYDLNYDRAALPPKVARALDESEFRGGVRVLVGGWDEVQGVAVGFEGVDVMHGVINATRGQGARLELAPDRARLFEDSRARKESLAILTDLRFSMAPGAPSRSGLLLALGFADGRMHLRLALPAQHFIDMWSARAGSAAR